jgi:hypothetical protein
MIRTILLVTAVIAIGYLSAPKANASLPKDVIVIDLQDYLHVVRIMEEMGHIPVDLPEYLSVKPAKKPVKG